MLYFFKGSIIMLALIFSIPASHGISIGGGTSIAAQSGSLAMGNFVADANGGTSIVIALGGISNLDEYHYVTDATGKHSEVMAHVINGDNINYNALILPRECNETSPIAPKSSFVSAQESLSADAADEVSAFASANNTEGDTANVGCNIHNATSLVYSNYARATASSAEARQSGSLSGNAIAFNRGAKNAEGDVVEGGPTGEDRAVIYNGSDVYFNNSVKATKSSAESSDVVVIGGCDELDMGIGVYNKEGDRIGSGPHVINGYVTQYSAKATSKKAGVSVLQIGDAGGMTVMASNQASDKWFSYGELPQGDIALCSAEVHGENVRYTLSASASKNKVQASEQLGSRAAYVGTNANGRYSRNDSADAYMAMSNGNGTSPAVISGYSVKVDTVPGKITVSQSASSISAIYTDIEVNAYNSKGDGSSASGRMGNNTTVNGYSGLASSSASAVSASQKIASISGNADSDKPGSINIGVRSWDAAGDGANAGANLRNFSSVNGYSGTTSSQKSQVLASESFLDLSALSGIAELFTSGRHNVSDNDSDWSGAGVFLINGTLDRASKTKGAYSATSTASSKQTSSKQDTVRARSWTDRVDVFTDAYSAVLGIGSNSGYNIFKKGKGGIFSTSASTASKGDAQTGAKYLGTY